MRRASWGWFWLAILIAWCGLTATAAQGCAKPMSELEPLTPPLQLLIDNRGFYDANVYVLVGSSVVRKVGTVDGFSSHRFVLVGSQFAPGQSIALYAKTIAEGRQYTSGAFTLYAGMGFRWTLESTGNEWLIQMSETK